MFNIYMQVAIAVIHFMCKCTGSYNVPDAKLYPMGVCGLLWTVEKKERRQNI
jgi:hypothetical protein